MENKKTLQINAAVCDVRAVTEEALSAYKQVMISCATLISSPESRALLTSCGAKINAAQTLDAPGNVRLSTVNGKMRMTPGQAAPAEQTFLMVNGKLDVEPGSEETLKRYAGVIVNGAVELPESMVGLLSGVSVNGAIRAYPDGAIRLNSTAVLDRTFPLRARQNALYHAASRIVALAGDIDFEKLAEKNVRFSTPTLVVAEGLAEAAVPLFDEKTDIQILPDGCACLDGDAVLDESLVRRCGGKLYIDGDLTLLEDGPWLDRVTCLRVDGDVLVTRELEDRLYAMDAAYEDLYVVGGTLLTGKSELRLTRAVLEGAENGLSAVSCAAVKVAEDVPVQLLRDRLVSVVACASVTCTEEQRAVIEPLAQKVSSIGPEEEETEKENDPNEVTVNSAVYIL